MRTLLLLISLLSLCAVADVTMIERVQINLLRGSSTVQTLDSWAACIARARQLAMADTRTSGTVNYTCQTERRQVIATYTAGTPPPVAVNCVVNDPAWTLGAPTPATCPASGQQSRTDTRTLTVLTPAANGGTACPALNQSRTQAVTCTPPVVVPPPPPPPGPVDPQLLSPLLNFAETWARNWNHGGHAVDSRFNENYGLWDYTESTYEPWLFDRATVGYRLFELTGDTKWRTKFLSDFAYYRAHIDSQGIFTPKGFGDTKYGYVTPFLLYEKVTPGDTQYRPIAKRIYDSWIREWPNTFSPNSAQLWTEREMAFAMEAAIGWYELTQDQAALMRAQALVVQWTAVSGSVGAPLVSYTRHEGGGPGGTTPSNLTNSPWMSALYFQATRRLHAITGDPAILTQVSKYFDWLDANGFYDAALAHPQYAGLTFPRYLTGELIGDAGYDYGNMAHCLDILGLIDFAGDAKRVLGQSTVAADTRLAHMKACALADYQEWTRSTTYLPRYRLSPPRKANWQIRGLHETWR